MTDCLHRKLRALACRYWALTPPAFDALVEAGDLAYADVYDLVSLLRHDITACMWIDAYLFPVTVEAKQQEAEATKQENKLHMQMAQMLPFIKPDTPEKAQKIEAARAYLAAREAAPNGR